MIGRKVLHRQGSPAKRNNGVRSVCVDPTIWRDALSFPCVVAYSAEDRKITFLEKLTLIWVICFGTVIFRVDDRANIVTRALAQGRTTSHKAFV